MWKKFQKFPPCRLQDIRIISISSDKNHFFGLAKNMATALHKVTFVWKLFYVCGALNSFFNPSFLHA